MRILLVHVWYWPHVGGGDQHVEQLARELVKLGHDVSVWCADLPAHEEKEFIRGGVKVTRLIPKRVLGGIDPVVDIDYNAVKGFDIIHLHDTLPILIRKVSKAARKSDIPVVTTYHNDYIKRGIISNSIKRIRWVLQGRKTLHSSRAIIVLTTYFAELLRTKGVKGEIDIIPNGFSPIDEDAKRPQGLRENREILTFVGRLSEQKGLDILLDAWDIVSKSGDPGFDLAIAGKGELKDWLDNRASSVHYKEGLRVLGLVSEGEKRWLLENSCGIIIPSRFEGLPTVMLEAMHARTPVMMADVNDLGRLVTDPGAGISVPSENSQAVAEAMMSIYSADEETKTNWGNSGAKASKEYMWPVITKNVLSLYHRVLGVED